MKADSHSHIGLPHTEKSQPCQDYPLSSVLTASAYAIVADGCSTGRHTDMGARVIAFASARVFETWDGKPYPGAEAIVADLRRQWKCAIATVVGGVMSLEPQDMYATCICSFITPQGGFVHVQGDGLVALKYKDGRIVMRNYEWARPNPTQGGAPPYPLYSLDGYNQFVALHGGDETAEKLTEVTREYIPNAEPNKPGSFNKLESKGIALKTGKLGTTLLITAEELSNLDRIAIFTDGIEQIQSHENWWEVVADLLALKNPNSYARKNLRWVLEEYAKASPKHVPMDDLSMATIHPHA